jgi:hypothetical protein
MIEHARMRHLGSGSHHGSSADAPASMWRDFHLFSDQSPLPLNKVRVMTANFHSRLVRLQDLEAFLAGPYLS